MPEYPWIIYRMSEGPLTVKEVHQGVNEQLNRKLGTDWGYSEYEWANLLQGFRPLPIKTASGSIAHFTDGADSVPFKSLTAQILPIQSGTGTPSPSNPRPISGTNVLNVEQTGANLFPFETVSGTTYAEKSISLEASTYTLSLVASGNSSTQMRTIFQYTDNSYGGECLFNKDTREAKTVTLAKPVKALLFYAADTYPASVGFTFEYTDIQLELGSTATTYEPYNAETYTFDLGQEIVGGTADVVGGVGESVYKHKTIETISAWSGSTSSLNYWASSISDMKQVGSYIDDIYSDVLARITTLIAPFGVYRVGRSYVITVPNTYTIEEYNDNIAGHDLYYPLNTPTEYTFTGQPIESYLGTNNLYVDSGEVLDVEYRSNF